MMHIAMLTNNYKPIVGGVPVSIDCLSTALRQRGHKVTIFAPDFGCVKTERGVVRFPSRRLHPEQDIFIPDIFDDTIKKHFASISFDLIHVHHPVLAGKIGLQMAEKYDIPLAFTYHTRYEYYLHYLKPYAALQNLFGGELTLIKQMVAAHNRKFMEECDLVFAPTPLIKNCLEEQAINTPIVVLPTGLNDNSFAWDEKISQSLRQTFSQGKRFLFCSVSRLATEKNIPFLLQALVRFKEQHGDCFRMMLIGDGPCRQELEQTAKTLGLGKNVIFTGNLPHQELKNYYKACDLFLFASQSETQGLVLLESMAAGLPVVAVKASGVCDVVVNGKNGEMTTEDEGDFSHTVAAIVFSRDTHALLRQGAVATARSNTGAIMAANAESFYEWMMERKKATQQSHTFKKTQLRKRIIFNTKQE